MQRLRRYIGLHSHFPPWCTIISLLCRAFRSCMVSAARFSLVAQSEMAGVVADLKLEAAHGEASWREIMIENQTFRNVVVIGMVVQFAQIITGINALVSFSGIMFRQLGATGISAAVLPFVAFLAGNMVGSFLLVDRLGRRPILVLGMAAMAASLLVAGTGVGGTAAIVCVATSECSLDF
eukprot:COSAG01_NODE_2244_length_8081_cov_4.590829_2_plen_180_part_00